MPVLDVERLRKREGSLRKKIAENDASSDPVRRRRLGKSLKRAQRKRRVLLARQARIEKAAAAKAAQAAAAGGATPAASSE